MIPAMTETTTLAEPLNRLAVLIRAGGIIPEQAPTSKAATTARHMVLKVFSGSKGSFRLYGDSGTGLGYTKGQFTETSLTDATASRYRIQSRFSIRYP